MKSTKEPTAYEGLIAAAKELLANATDTGECHVEADFDEEFDYPRDEDGDYWYHDWWKLQQALQRCESEAVAHSEAMVALDNLAFEAKGYLDDLARHGVDATCLIGAIRRAEKTIKKAKE